MPRGYIIKITVNFKVIKETVSECTNYIHPMGDTVCLLYFRDVYLTHTGYIRTSFSSDGLRRVPSSSLLLLGGCCLGSDVILKGTLTASVALELSRPRFEPQSYHSPTLRGATPEPHHL